MATVHQALLLGSSRLAGVPDAPHPILAAAWSALDWQGAPETALLDAAALVATVRCAGARAGAGPAERPRAQEETRRVAPAPAAALLQQLLADEMRPLLPEWLDLAARAGCVIPPFHLPRLFREVSRAERAAFVAVAGVRGAWLAAQHPEWAWLANPDEAPSLGIWETGTPAQRLTCLAAARRVDPAQARAWLEQTWADETPDFRAAALGTLEHGLSRDDEPLLVRCLADRRRETRQQAQLLLARLPGSAFARRMRERAGSILTLKRGLLSRQLEIALPPAFDPSWKSDGLEEKPPAGTGEKAFWVQQILALVPVAHWSETLGLTAADLVKAAQKGEWGALLVEAWLRALPLGAPAGLAAALFEPVLVAPSPPPTGTRAAEIIGQMFAGCDEAERWKLTAKFGGDRWLAWWCVPHLRAASSPDEGRAVLQHLSLALRDGTAPGGTPAAVAAARAFPPDLRDEAARLLERESGLSKPAEYFLQALDLRAAMRAAFGLPS